MRPVNQLVKNCPFYIKKQGLYTFLYIFAYSSLSLQYQLQGHHIFWISFLWFLQCARFFSNCKCSILFGSCLSKFCTVYQSYLFPLKFCKLHSRFKKNMLPLAGVLPESSSKHLTPCFFYFFWWGLWWNMLNLVNHNIT